MLNFVDWWIPRFTGLVSYGCIKEFHKTLLSSSFKNLLYRQRDFSLMLICVRNNLAINSPLKFTSRKNPNYPMINLFGRFSLTRNKIYLVLSSQKGTGNLISTRSSFDACPILFTYIFALKNNACVVR